MGMEIITQCIIVLPNHRRRNFREDKSELMKVNPSCAETYTRLLTCPETHLGSPHRGQERRPLSVCDPLAGKIHRWDVARGPNSLDCPLSCRSALLSIQIP